MLSGGGVTDTAQREKLIYFHPGLAPKRVFLDGEVAASTPRGVLAASGLNAIHHCLEALYSKGRHPISDALATTALATLLEVLPAFAPTAPPPAAEAAQRALDASAISGLTYANSGLGVGHAICHSLGGRYGLSHSAANAVIVRHSLRFNLPAAEAPLARAARILGFRGEDDAMAARHVVVLVDALADRLGTPKTLREIGLPAGQFAQIAKDVLADIGTYSNPRTVTQAAVIGLLEKAW
jgi:alcohol dehydrogenase class IV